MMYMLMVGTVTLYYDSMIKVINSNIMLTAEVILCTIVIELYVVQQIQ